MVEALGEVRMFMLPEHIEGVDVLAEDTHRDSCLSRGGLGQCWIPVADQEEVPLPIELPDMTGDQPLACSVPNKARPNHPQSRSSRLRLGNSIDSRILREASRLSRARRDSV